MSKCSSTSTDHSTQHKHRKRNAAAATTTTNHFAHHNWNHIRKILTTPRQRHKLCRHKDEYNTPSLALAVGFLAPLDIIEHMYQINPAAAFETDNSGANVLHIACLNGASYDCIDYILSQEQVVGVARRQGEDLATQLDHEGSCALHHAVEFACIGREDAVSYAASRHDLKTTTDEDEEDQQSYLSVIQRVIRAAPQMINAQYNDGKATPIDIVQYIKADTNTASKEYLTRLEDIYHVLLRASIELYMTRKKAWEEDRKGGNRLLF